jgi:pyridoxal phosphate enzyme (YggS family)
MNVNKEEKALIEKNIKSVQTRIEQAAYRSGRNPDEIQLVAISKSQRISKVRHAYTIGLRNFGENRVYEALPKMEQLDDLTEICWHMVGHIQSRKARDVPANFSWVHSVDRVKIARRLDRFAEEAEKEMKVLLECNVSGEETKEGWNLKERSSWSEILPVFEEILEFHNLEICGLMTMAPFFAEEAVLRTVFRNLRELRDFLSANLPGSWKELSMGMTDDFEIAIEEGSTMVRIGRAIFGPREDT